MKAKTVLHFNAAKWRVRIALSLALHQKDVPDDSETLDKAMGFFKAGNYKSAVNAFTVLINAREGVHATYLEILLRCLAHRAACWLKLDNYAACIQDCNASIAVLATETEILTKELKKDDGREQQRIQTHARVLARRGMAYFQMGSVEKCISDYQQALELAPGDHGLMQDLEQAQKIYNDEHDEQNIGETEQLTKQPLAITS